MNVSNCASSDKEETFIAVINVVDADEKNSTRLKNIWEVRRIDFLEQGIGDVRKSKILVIDDVRKSRNIQAFLVNAGYMTKSRIHRRRPGTAKISGPI
jgi:uncharacterized ferredoxin-like protein